MFVASEKVEKQDNKDVLGLTMIKEPGTNHKEKSDDIRSIIKTIRI
jgi:hypothetical protein